ncbi:MULTISPECIES: ABC transporter ATP-binding protein [unclassified Roseateles]|uniref:ABC transporter ATP-binding protein n=1 Tax=unclassified Roseateles TaxID=2626991 RepID=UPI000701B56E|nr:MULTISPECIES: ABC transporter ATP-binding protein [unclassified Roseateles]KQW42186.1 ABC transporter ATP-binding protein [Pelomonas sp. Root405]KRA68059.1 ABC transporter ATP-binding protein [Pelomonas sp. Root662]
MLQIQDVVKTFGKINALDGVSLDLKPGVVGLIGHNGAGKSTLMQMLATLTKPSSGRILLDGQDIVARPELMRQRLGYLPQDFGVYPHLTALEFLQYFAALKGVRDAQRLRELLELVNLHEQAHRPAAGFSGGMRQRLGIAQALLNNPDVLIVDEPTAGLDPEERLRFRHLLGDLGRQRLVIVSTHIVSDVENMASHLAVMRQGRLVAFETPDAVLARAAGQLWTALLEPADYEALRAHVHVLQAQPQGGRVQVRIAHPTRPFAEAQPVQASLEEALMAQRYADARVAA